LTEKELFDVFVHYYNLDRNEFDKEAAKNKNMFYPEKVSVENQSVIQGFLRESVVMPNFKIIDEYVSLPLSKVSSHYMMSLYGRWPDCKEIHTTPTTTEIAISLSIFNNTLDAKQLSSDNNIRPPTLPL
jgi:hypothetical protein